MSISPINFNGMIQNTNEVSNTKAQEDQKPVLQQANITVEVQKQQEELAHQVNQLGELNKEEYRYDREGNGKGYQGNKNKKKDKNNDKADGKVTKKKASSFDIRI